MKNKQKGMVTLFVSIMLLLLVTLNVFIGAKGSVVEQKSANNAYRTEEAFQNAESQLALIKVAITNDITKSNTNLNPLTAAQVIAKYLEPASNCTTGFPCISGAWVTTTGTNITGLKSIGFGSGNAIKTVTQRITLTGSTGGGAAAINTLGSADFAGNASATNVKSGGQVTFSGSGSVGGSNTTTNNASITQNSTEFKVYDAASNTGYRAMTGDEYFMYWFGGLCLDAKADGDAASCKVEALRTVRADVQKGYVCDSNCGSLDDSTLSAKYSLGKRIFWLEGGMNHKLTLGSVADPVLVLVMNVVDGGGTVHINGNSDINGVLYVDILPKNCNCQASSTVTAISYAPREDYSNVITWTTYPYVIGNICVASGNKSCTQKLSDGHGNIKTVTTAQGSKLVDPSLSVITYGTMSSGSPILTTPLYSLTGTNVAACTVLACQQAEVKCIPTTTITTVGSVISCKYTTNAVQDASQAVQIDITGTWDNSGGGNTLIRGTTITSGSFTGQGKISFIKDDAAIVKTILTGATGVGFNSVPAQIVVDPRGWSDMN